MLSAALVVSGGGQRRPGFFVSGKQFVSELMVLSKLSSGPNLRLDLEVEKLESHQFRFLKFGKGWPFSGNSGSCAAVGAEWRRRIAPLPLRF